MESVRKLVQIIATFLTNSYFLFPQTKNIYQGPLKAICSPGLNCYSCPASTSYCPIGAIQQLLLGIRFSLETGAYYLSFYVVGTIGLIGTATGRITCGWLCPFGFLQEMLYKIKTYKMRLPSFSRYIKYIVLALTFIIPIFFHEPFFCKFI